MAQAKTYKKRFQNQAKAEKYAQRFEDGSHKRIDAREQRAVASIFSALNGCQTVLDVPCGAGRFAAIIAKGRRLIETDVAHEMVAIAKHRAEKGGVKSGHLQS